MNLQNRLDEIREDVEKIAGLMKKFESAKSVDEIPEGVENLLEFDKFISVEEALRDISYDIHDARDAVYRMYKNPNQLHPLLKGKEEKFNDYDPLTSER